MEQTRERPICARTAFFSAPCGLAAARSRSAPAAKSAIGKTAPPLSPPPRPPPRSGSPALAASPSWGNVSRRGGGDVSITHDTHDTRRVPRRQRSGGGAGGGGEGAPRGRPRRARTAVEPAPGRWGRAGPSEGGAPWDVRHLLEFLGPRARTPSGNGPGGVEAGHNSSRTCRRPQGLGQGLASSSSSSSPASSPASRDEPSPSSRLSATPFESLEPDCHSF